MEQIKQEGQSREQKKERAERLISYTKEIASLTNQEMEEKYGIKGFLDEDGAIDMENYAKRGASISPADLKIDLDEIREREIEWAGADDEDIRAYYSKMGISTAEGIISFKKKNKKKEKNGQCEMIVMAILWKFLRENFIVAHSSAHDDHENHIDNVLVSKTDGQPVCTFDELCDHEDDRRAKKEKRMRKINLKGTNLKYGFCLKAGEIVEKSISNLPVFCLSLTGAEVEELMEKMNLSVNGDLSEIERLTMKKFLESLDAQKEEMKKMKLDEAVRSNLGKFESSLEQMKKMVE